MNRNRIIKLTTIIALASIVLLIYWVFIFVSITVFDFKVFRENLTEAFYLSVVGIFALIAGALIVNVIFNLTKIADSLDQGRPGIERVNRGAPVLWVLFILSFPALFALLYFGDAASSAKKEQYLVSSAETVIQNNREDVNFLTDYKFTAFYIDETAKRLRIISREDEHFPSVSVIHMDTINDREKFLLFSMYTQWDKYKGSEKSDYLYSCSKEEREYLHDVFEGKRKEQSFSAADGHYELYFPVETEKGRAVLYFSDTSRYGKIGS